MAVVTIEYLFYRGERVLASIPLQLDADAMTLEEPITQSEWPDWARLDFKQCPNCPLRAADTTHCPFAQRLVEPLETLAPLQGQGRVTLRLVTEFGTSSEEISVERAVSSLMGLIGAGSGCPQMAFLRPLARFSLPLAAGADTVSRAAALYTLAQVFLRTGGATNEALAGLSQLYKDVQTVNAAMAKRLRAALTSVDAPVRGEQMVRLFADVLPRTADDQLNACRHRLAPPPAA